MYLYMGVLLPRVQCKCCFFLLGKYYTIYVACTGVASASLSSPLITTLCSDQKKNKNVVIKPKAGLLKISPFANYSAT